MDIKHILIKHLFSTLSPKEHEQLREWLMEDEHHVSYFQKISTRHNYSELYQQYREQHAASIRRRMITRILMRVAACLILPLMIVTASWLIYNSSHQPSVTPGIYMATLHLSNGHSVKLNYSYEDEWIRLNNQFMAADSQGNLHIQSECIDGQLMQNMLETPRGGEFKLILPDGTHIHLNSETKLIFPLAFGDSSRTVKLLSGEAYFEIAKDASRPFYVEVGDLRVRQYGTSFNISARSPQSIIVALEEGSIGIFQPNANEPVMISPGELAVYHSAGHDLSVATVDLEPHTAWHFNRFVFDNASLGEIMETLSLWYNLDVRFLDAQLADLHFTGNMSRYEDIHVILNAIHSMVDVNIEMDGNEVRIMRED